MHDEDSKIWQPGIIDLCKLTTGFSYLHSSTCTSPPLSHSTPSLDPFTRLRKHIRKRTRCLKRRHTSQLIKTALLDSGATSHFNKPSDNLPIIGPSHKTVAVAFGQSANMTASAMLPMTQLHALAHKTHILPALSPNSLLSVGTFANHGYPGILDSGTTSRGLIRWVRCHSSL